MEEDAPCYLMLSNSEDQLTLTLTSTWSKAFTGTVLQAVGKSSLTAHRASCICLVGKRKYSYCCCTVVDAGILIVCCCEFIFICYYTDSKEPKCAPLIQQDLSLILLVLLSHCSHPCPSGTTYQGVSEAAPKRRRRRKKVPCHR